MDRVERKISSGVYRTEIIEYFLLISNSFDSEGTFRGPDWEVLVDKQEYRGLGSISLPVTVVIFRAEKHRCNEIMTAFRITFLSAGG